MLRLLSDEDVHLLENIGAGQVIEDILLVAQCAAPEEIRDQVLFIPF